MPNSVFYDTPEIVYNKFVRCIGEKSLKPLPTRSTISDDFLIEALDIENKEELIAKITAKYSIEQFSTS